ncbi:hypothetical protein M9H77_22869 [Catharanthus roseus]|uniref:Uncharacterized protein n=1 Tax=Catharanthus roseus TaxID=4058 RepID=A0ACC0ASF1_CATRO|nr:hypothetical protein M9H77_22869 [Catharanthus roseus]
MEVKLGPITRAQRKKLKIHEDNGMVAYVEEALKRKLEEFEGQERASKLFSMCSISKDRSKNKLEEKMTKSLKETTLPAMVALGPTLPVGFWIGKLWSSRPTTDEFLFPDPIYLRSSSLCSWGFEALVSSRFFLSN